MTDLENDSKPTVDTLTYIELDATSNASEDGDDGDFFICRKCNKVFKNLSVYVEHKIREENYRVSQTRSKADKRFSLPQLVQKKKRRPKKKEAPAESKQPDGAGTVEVGDKETVEAAVPESGGVSVSPQLPDEVFSPASQKEHTEKADISCKDNDSSQSQEQSGQSVPKQKGVKKPAAAVPIKLLSGTNGYSCSICHRSFRRNASLRWHKEYEHKSRDDDSENSEDLDKDLNEELSDKDEEYKVDADHELKQHEKDKSVSKGETGTDVHIGTDTSPEHQNVKKRINKQTRTAGSVLTDRPYSCELCGRAFKELTVLKAHQVVHSGERKYLCTFENCPYGFKTKGCLIRHIRRHTGERPYECERCGRAFAESGALTRHMKARRNCSQVPDSQFPRYRKSWTYHPNIPAVIDPSQRDAQHGRSTLPQPALEGPAEEPPVSEVHFIISSHQASEVVNSAEVVIETADADTLDKDEGGAQRDWTLSGDDELVPSALTIVSGTDEASTMMKVLDSTEELQGGDEKMEENDDDLMELKMKSEIEFLKPTQCHVCRKELKAIEGLEIHLRTHLVDQPSHCGLCHFLSNNREDLRQHILAMHYDSLNDIEASVLSMETSDLNKGQTMQDKKSILRDALVAVKQLYTLKKNKENSDWETAGSATGSFKCMVCNRTFRGNNYLRLHMRMHTGDRPYKCTRCNSSFTSRDILKKHMYVHTEQRNFKCGECGKMFKRLAHVQQHLRVHFQERSFRCIVCDKLLKSQNSLKVHMRTHSGINPYKCHICSRHFRERGSLHRHLRLHTGERPYVCPHCNRGFAEQGTLARHLKAKMPCSSNRDADPERMQGSDSTVLAQFSSMVADTQQYILPQVDGGQHLILPEVQNIGHQEELSGEYVMLQTAEGAVGDVVEDIEVITNGADSVTTSDLVKVESDEQDMETVYTATEGTETLQVVDPSTGESVIIVADKSIVDLIKEQQLSFESESGESSLQRIKDLIIAAGVGKVESTYIPHTQLIDPPESVNTNNFTQDSSMEPEGFQKVENSIEDTKIVTEVVETQS